MFSLASCEIISDYTKILKTTLFSIISVYDLMSNRELERKAMHRFYSFATSTCKEIEGDFIVLS